ncbi:DMT family transporter [Leifsonia sp. H3M29-4]|uniref:DMT family transporter n=1 Tax=Salinibacterium metalliresistens TaxID=3031321 RepID=UPI0023DB6AD8|nr:DMT family transporter [Salinibacterium metalliresistens]MDF1479726.1 DMT family transporter [Salinibacterium metalliresistens]
MLWVTLSWGSCFVAISIGLQDAPLLWLAAMRALTAGVALLLVTGIRRTPLPRDRHTWVLIVCLGVVNVALAYAAMFGGIIGLSTGVAAILANVQPILILLPAWWLYHERPSRTALVAMLLGLAGLLLIVLPAGLGTGAWLSLSSAVAVTIGTLISRVVRADPFVVAAAQLLIGGAVLAIAAAVVEGPPTINWNVRFVLVLLFMSLVGTAATTVAWFAEARRARLDILTTWTLLVPVVGIALSLVFLDERQSVWGWVGTAVVLVSMLVLVVTPRRSPSNLPDQLPPS